MKSLVLKKAHWIPLATFMTLLICTTFFGCTKTGQTAAQVPTPTYMPVESEADILMREINAIMQIKLSALEKRTMTCTFQQ